MGKRTRASQKLKELPLNHYPALRAPLRQTKGKNGVKMKSKVKIVAIPLSLIPSLSFVPSR